MHISWLGTSALKLQVKPLDEEVIIVIDPYKPEAGAFPRSLTPNIGLFSRGQTDAITLSGNPFVIDTPGEYEVKGVLVTALQGKNQNEVLFRIDAEGMSVGHLGLTKQELTNRELELLSDVDILCVSVGHPSSYDTEAAVKTVNAIEPRIVILMGYQSENDPKAKPVSAFLKEMGAKSPEPEKKLIMKKKDLPQEEVQVVVLAKE